MMMRILIFGYLITFISVVSLCAQTQQAVQHQYKFKSLTVDQGLSNNNIRSICQDSIGFIWIATQNGINKFDGQSIVIYNHDPKDSSTLSSNLLNSVFLDSKSKLWVGGSSGIDIYNTEYDNFTRFKHKDINWPIGLVYSIAEDKDGKVWFGGASGLYVYDLNTSQIRHYSNKPGNPHGIPAEQIYKILVDRNNKVWISILNKGLCVYNQSNSTFEYYTNNPDDPSTISGNRIESLYEDAEGNIWAGTLNEGINRFLPESKTFIRTIPDPNNSYSQRVRAIFEDYKGDFFIGTRIGLFILNKLTNKYVPYANEGHNFSGLTQNSILCSFIDKTGTLWIGTFSGGVNYTNLNRKEFIHYTAGKNDPHFLSGANIYAVTEDSEGNLWVGGDNGLNYLDRTTHTFRYYLNDPTDPNSISYNDIKTFEWDVDGNLWIGTNKGGLNHYDVKTDKFKSYKHDPNNPNSIAGNKIYCLMFDKDKNLWIILSPINDFDFLCIDILPYNSDKFIHLNEKSYFGLDQDENGDVYIGGVKGFWIFSKKDSTYNYVSNENQIGNVYSIKKDSKGILWIGSTKGLVRYNMEDQSFAVYTEEYGYPISGVYGILEDDANNLWVSTSDGLVKIKNIVNDTGDIKIRVFDHFDGLQSKQFNYNASHKCKSGEMIFGGINGFNTFFPNKIIENSLPPDVIFTDLKIFNTSVPIGEKVGDRVVLTKSISVTQEITLGPKQNIFTIEFASLQDVNPKKNTFKYKLEGLDKDWQYRKAGNNFATYTNLAAGEYTFFVTAANNDGIWNEEPLKLKIIITPPFWKTWWFILLAGLATTAIVVGIYYYRLRSIRHQNKLLEETVKKRTSEISDKNEEILSQNEELEKHRNKLESLVRERTMRLQDALSKSKESDELKSAFLANMSHEIRTPMNAITGFSDLLNESSLTAKERAEYIRIIQSNSKDLLKIIDEILDLSLLESNQLRLKKEVFYLNVIVDHLYSYYFLNNSNSKVAIRKNNTLHDLNLKLTSDSVRLKQIIINLMDNANKFTEEGYIEIGTYIDHDNLCIYVEDTGRGIPSKGIDRIFQQFTKIEDDEEEWTRGLGLGLAISKKITDALGGMIGVKSEQGKGSIFTFSIPINRVITEEDIIVQQFRESVPIMWQGKTILIAEDVEANYLYLKNVLKNTQANIIWVKNGKEALQLAVESPQIDLILMDIKMPKMNGQEAAKKIKQHNPAIKIIAQTAYARPEEKNKFFDENFDDYISKPIKPEDLIMVLEKFL